MAPAIRRGYGTPAGKLVAASGCVVQFGITVIDIVGHQLRSGNLLSHARMEPCHRRTRIKVSSRSQQRSLIFPPGVR